MNRLIGQIRKEQLFATINLVPSATSGGPLQAKTVYPSHSEQTIAPDEDYYGLAVVTVKPVPRVPACEISIKVGADAEVEIPLNIGARVEVCSAHYEYDAISYQIHANGWFMSNNDTISTNDPVVHYSFPVEKGVTYCIKMTEIGNRLRFGFTTVDPNTINGTISGIISGYTDLTSSLTVGFEYTYTAEKDGWYLVYVSNQGERPTISVAKRTIVEDE